MDIVYDKKDIIVSPGMGASKSLIYQTIFLINPGAIILTITSTIMLMKHQNREFGQKDISALALIIVTVKTKLNILK